MACIAKEWMTPQARNQGIKEGRKEETAGEGRRVSGGGKKTEKSGGKTVLYKGP